MNVGEPLNTPAWARRCYRGLLAFAALLLVWSTSLPAAPPDTLHYAFEAFNPHGLIIATGRLRISVYDEREDGSIAFFAVRRHERLGWGQHDFTGRGDAMDGSIEGDRITLSPGIFSNSGYIRIEGRFTAGRFGAFGGFWRHKYNTRAGYGEFRAWPVAGH